MLDTNVYDLELRILNIVQLFSEMMRIIENILGYYLTWYWWRKHDLWTVNFLLCYRRHSPHKLGFRRFRGPILVLRRTWGTYSREEYYLILLLLMIFFIYFYSLETEVLTHHVSPGNHNWHKDNDSTEVFIHCLATDCLLILHSENFSTNPIIRPGSPTSVCMARPLLQDGMNDGPPRTLFRL